MLIKCDYENNLNDTLKARKNKVVKNKDTFKKSTIIPLGSTVAVQQDDCGLITH